MDTTGWGNLKPLAFFVTLALPTASTGCRSLMISEHAARDVTQQFETGRERFLAADYPAAQSRFDSILASPTALTADQYVEVLLLRSICLTVAGDLDGAEADIQHAAQGGGSPALQLIAEACLLEKRGDNQSALQKRRHAVRIDRDVIQPAF